MIWLNIVCDLGGLLPLKAEGHLTIPATGEQSAGIACSLYERLSTSFLIFTSPANFSVWIHPQLPRTYYKLISLLPIFPQR
ncbi:hypothetical protein MPTK1_7g12380 [Marchantia polymorpha subsp. ruderalis]|uniref:Uncharacterized protein n=2 Tax=Marchantia polymorpha TaxID=3197 RepID=A0AAF6BYR9_MARPO|nr:hypothetical protein MARPO_0003s0249 [Marchantia polymorpha]BBN17153.1 hypothetical protein Mp_7g12380 [Marchantia polymorpha subsp. ruderalis]|eukprot:PTQ49389.1 hypothetical protein MARPO_0003s0249 [Marchantia polymorpha]